MLGIIGGTGLSRELLEKSNEIAVVAERSIDTPYGQTSSYILELKWHQQTVLFLSRHGDSASIAPHQVNYRANIWALKTAGATHILAIAAVGGIGQNCQPETLVVPDQIIDYTWGRDHSFVGEIAGDSTLSQLQYINFCEPYTQHLRHQLLNAAKHMNADDLIQTGCYGATQGPRLETAAEIQRMRQDGCTVVGMTGMPEAALAMEAGLSYACLALVVNWAAGIKEKEASLSEIYTHIEQGGLKIQQVVEQFVSDMQEDNER